MMGKRATRAALATMVVWAAAAQAETVESIGRPPAGRWSVDLTGRFTGDTLTRFDRIAEARDRSGSGQLGLAVVRTTSGEVPRQFATRLFNQWGVGHRGRNDGVLLFFALDDRKAEIILGDGFPPGSTTITDRIMVNDVVANMKQGRLDDAVLAATSALDALIADRFGGAPLADAAQAAEIPAQPPTKEEQLVAAWETGEEPLPEKSPRGWVIDSDDQLNPSERAALDRLGDSVYAAGRDMLFVVITRTRNARFTVLADTLRRQLKRDRVWVVGASTDNQTIELDVPEVVRFEPNLERARRELFNTAASEMYQSPVAAITHATQRAADFALNGAPSQPVSEMVGAVYDEHPAASLGGVGGFGVLGLVGVRTALRRRTRRCKGCGTARTRLSEDTDDPHLNPGQQTEERLGSVDYDVWWCGRCNDALVIRYGAIFTSYKSCNGCGVKAARSTSNTLVHATYDHGGTVEVTTTCQHCGNSFSETRYTSRLTRDTSSSSSSSSGGFGGGSSSGSGSSGSW